MSRRVFDALVDEGATYSETRVVRVRDLHLPIHICLGQYEAATSEEINDLITDLSHELSRR
jgi:hypothetical protein